MSETLRRLASVIYNAPSKRYLTYLRSPQWKLIRDEHLQACDRWCEICRKAAACQVHHGTYVRLGNELPCDLAAVCVTCHHRLHCMVPDAANDNQLTLDLVADG